MTNAWPVAHPRFQPQSITQKLKHRLVNALFNTRIKLPIARRMALAGLLGLLVLGSPLLVRADNTPDTEIKIIT
ncbi:MAG: hypothetical protein RI962_227, partial [Pseudomonadota bacterium]